MVTLLSQLGPRARKVLRYAGFGVLALVSFIFAFQLSFPFDRVKDKAIEALSEKYDVTIGDVERGILPGRMYFKAVSLRTRPTRPGDFVTTFYMEQLEVDLGLFALLHGTLSVKLDAKIGSGHLKGKVAVASDGYDVDVVGDDLPSASLPTREVLGLPMSGKVRFAFNLDLPVEKSKTGKLGPVWTKAEGGGELSCPSGCTVGDGKTKLKMNLKNMRNQAFAEGGIDFGKVNIDTLLARIDIKNGKLTVTRFDTKSADGELHVDFEMAFNQQDVQQSMVTGCLRFNGSASLLKREPKTHAAISATGAPLGPDNLFHIKLDGPLRDVRRLGQVCGSGAGAGVDSAGGTARPNLTITPEAPSRPGSAGAAPVPPPMMPPPPPAGPEDAGVADALRAPPAEGEAPATGSASPPSPAPPTGAAMPPAGPPGAAAPQ
ncbi:MAG TPA: type II secretion system protein GspN [Kofleriaceae bacterium]|nr:type II secretion system protein GspN [Kofleriaceae bacterium]